MKTVENGGKHPIDDRDFYLGFPEDAERVIQKSTPYNGRDKNYFGPNRETALVFAMLRKK